MASPTAASDNPNATTSNATSSGMASEIINPATASPRGRRPRPTAENIRPSSQISHPM